MAVIATATIKDPVTFAEGVSDTPSQPDLQPAPERWVRLEVFGHRQHYGRLTKVQEFGAEFARVEELCPRGHLIRPPVQYPGSAIFSLAEIPEAEAKRYAGQYDACPHAECRAERVRALPPRGDEDDQPERDADSFDYDNAF